MRHGGVPPGIDRPGGREALSAPGRGAGDCQRWGVLFVLTMLFALPLVTVLLCDWRLNGTVVWSGYVAGALVVLYVVVVLPLWFRRGTPVVFVAADFVAAGLYLLYINAALGGRWFLPFAFPVTGGLMVISVGAVTLLHYLRRGHLFIIAGTVLATGGFMVLVEFLLNVTFGLHERLIWSIYPLACCLLLGLMLIVVACVPLCGRACGGSSSSGQGLPAGLEGENPARPAVFPPGGPAAV